MNISLVYVITIIIKFFRYYVDICIDIFFGVYYDRKRQYIPDIENQIIMESAVNLANKIRNRELTSTEVVQAFIERIKQVNPILNAVVDECFELALQQAKRIDLDIGAGNITPVVFDSKPFLGVPFTIKESVACRGMSSTLGLKQRQNKKAVIDADLVKLLKKAGAILLGVTNTPQINKWQETSNPVYGLTKNPYNTTRNVGGSSGGEACIVSACGSPLGLGTDGGGSSRLPAFMCGIFSHKLTNGSVSLKGATFFKNKYGGPLTCLGPLVKYAADLIPFIKVFLEPEQIILLKLDQQVSLRAIKIYFISDPADFLICPFKKELKNVFQKALNHMEEVTLSKGRPIVCNDLRHAYSLFKFWMDRQVDFKNDINNKQGEVNALVEVIKHFTSGGQYSIATILNLASGFIKPVDENWAIPMTKRLMDFFFEILDENSILLYPSAPFTARYHHTALLRPFNINLFAIWNVLRCPATQVPMGLAEDGLPLGIQIVAAPYQDRLCIAVAKELEKAFGGYVPPRNIKKLSVKRKI